MTTMANATWEPTLILLAVHIKYVPTIHTSGEEYFLITKLFIFIFLLFFLIKDRSDAHFTQQSF